MGQTSGPLTQSEASPLVKPKSVIRAMQWIVKKDNDVVVEVRQAIGQKPHEIKVKVGGDIDGRCTCKNVWDELMWIVLPHILNINILQWDGHNPKSLEN